MDKKKVIKLLTGLRTDKHSKQDAPHKPLLMLFMLGRCWRGEPRMVRFQVADPIVRALVRRHKLVASSNLDAIRPFWAMHREDGIWELMDFASLRRKRAYSNEETPSFKAAVNSELSGGFSDSIQVALCSDKTFLLEVVFAVLGRYFPNHKHAELLQAVGVPDVKPHDTLLSEQQLIDEALEAYGEQCSVCKFGSTLLGSAVGLKPTQIKWESWGGPNKITNRLVLCTLHSELFSIGAFTLGQGYSIEVSSSFNEHDVTATLREVRDDQDISAHVPVQAAMRPSRPYLQWHRKNVFV